MNYKNIIEKVLEEYQENKNISRLDVEKIKKLVGIKE
jgi:hypothetical protein